MTSVYDDLSDDIHDAVLRACSDLPVLARIGHFWVDTDPAPILLLRYYEDQPQVIRREVTRRVVDNLRGRDLLVENPHLAVADDLVGHLMSGGWVTVRPAAAAGG